MKKTPELCRSSDHLLALLQGSLEPDAETDLQTHLDDCLSCRQQLEQIAADPAIWNEASQFLGEEFSNELSFANAANDCERDNRLPLQVRQVIETLSPTDDPAMLGRIGGYEVFGVVGAGGMGVVLKAHDRALDRVVAIKVLAPHLANSGSARQRFAREAKAAAAVIHPNVIAIYGVSNEESLPYLVMPFIGGSSLQRRLNTQGALPVAEVLRIGHQIAAGLAAAHSQGLVHRDIKPANIMLDDGVERVSITDFGLARAVDDASMTRTGVIAGTPQFMSPEQARGETMEHRSDLFSLGSVLYTMCTGRSPFRAETSYGVLRRITDDQPTAIREINPDVPAWLCQIIDKLLAKQPENRFESAEEVAVLLEECLAHVQQPTTTPLPESLCVAEPSSSSSSRFPPILKKLLAAAFAFFLILAGVLIVVELNKGKLTIECSADDVPIRVMQGDTVVEKMTVTKSGATIRVAAGTYVVEVDGDFDDMLVKDGSVVLKRGGNETVRIVKSDFNASIEKEVSKLEKHTKDIAEAKLVADKFITAKLRGRISEMEEYLSPSHDPKILDTEFMDKMMKIVFSLNPEIDEAYVHHQDSDDMLLATSTLPADKRINGPGRLLIGMKREKVGWRVCEVLFLTPTEAKQVVAFYESGVPLPFVLRYERDLNMIAATNPANVGKAEFGPQGLRAKIRVVAADTLEPVEDAALETILIGPDGGDGGFHKYTSDADGFITTDQYLWPGRYQIQIVPPPGSRYSVTQYSKQEVFLVVRKDGTYAPTEFRLAVAPSAEYGEGASKAGASQLQPETRGSSTPHALINALMTRKNFRWILGREEELLVSEGKLQPLREKVAAAEQEVLRIEQRVTNGDKDIDATEPHNSTTFKFDIPDSDDEALQLAKKVLTERRQALSGFEWRYRSISNNEQTPLEPQSISSIAFSGDKLLLGGLNSPDSLLYDRKRGVVSNPWAKDDGTPSDPLQTSDLRGYFDSANPLQVSGLLGVSEQVPLFVDELLDQSKSATAKWIGTGVDRLLEVEFSYLYESDDPTNFDGFFRVTYLLDPAKNYCPVEYRTRTRLGAGHHWKANSFHVISKKGFEEKFWFPKTMFFQSDNPKIYNGLEVLEPLMAASFFKNLVPTPTDGDLSKKSTQEANTAVAQTVLAMQRIQNRYRDIIYMVCSSRGLSEPSLSNSEFSEWLNRYSHTYDWLLDTFELSDREKHKAEFKSLVQRCRRLLDYQRDLIFTATHQAGRTEHDLSKLKSQKGRKPTQDMPSFRPELLSSTSITHHETELRAVESELDRVYEQLVDWTPFSKLQKKHAAFLEVLSRLPDDDGIEYFAADYRVTRSNIIGAKLRDVKSADFGDEGKLEKHEKIRWHLPTRRGYIEDDQYSRRKQYHFDGERHLEIIHYEDGLEANIADERSDRYDGVGLLYCDYVLRPFRGLRVENLPEPKISLRELLRGHEKRYGVITDRQFRIVEDTENLLRIDVVQSNWGNLNPGTTFEVTLDKGMNYAIVSIIQRSNLKEDNRVGVKFQRPTFEGKVERKTFFTDHVQSGDHWIPKRMVTFFDHEGRTNGAKEDENAKDADDPYRHAGVQKAEYVASYLSINKKEDMIELQIPADANVVDKRKEQGEAGPDEASVAKETGSRVKTEPQLATVEEVETHLRKVFEERKLLTNADVEFRLISDGDNSYNRRYHVWLSGESRRSDMKGVATDGRSDETQILTPRYSFFEDRIDGGPQYSARDPEKAKKPVGWNGVSCVPDLRKFGLIAWSVESIDSHPWGKNLLNKVRHDVRVETGKHDGHPITIVKSVNKYDNEHGKFEGRNEYWLSPAHGNLPIYLETRTTLPDAEKRVVVIKQHVQWKQFDRVWFPQKIEYIYQITGKQDNKTTLDVTAARFNLDPFPEVFDPLDAME